MTDDQLAIRQAAAILDSQPGGCIIADDNFVMPAYTRHYRLATRPSDLAGCAYVVVVTWTTDPPTTQRAVEEYPVRQTLPAIFPGLLLRPA